MASRQRDAVKNRFWREVLARQASSGLSGRAFCRQEQLAESAFYAWRRTIALRAWRHEPRATSRGLRAGRRQRSLDTRHVAGPRVLEKGEISRNIG